MRRIRYSPPPGGVETSEARSWGSGVGVSEGCVCGYPPPQPSPARGEGVHRCRGNVWNQMDQITPSAVALKNVARRFITPTGEILSALEDFDLSIAPGEFFAIVGPTGCGKSTTLGLIAGLAKPQGGEVTLFDAPVDGVDRRVGFVFQQDAVFPWRNVLGNVMAGPLFRGVPKNQAEATAR